MERNGRDARLALLTRRQAGALSFAQALELGYSSSTIVRRAASGAWERRFPGVYVLGGSEPTRRQALWCAVLAVGGSARISHESAALVCGAERLFARPITLTVPHGWHHAIPGLQVHQIDDAAPWQQTRDDGLPISTPARAVVELAATQSEASIGRTADDLVRLRVTTYPAIAAVLAHVSRPGKPGIAKVARVLDDRGGGYVPAASELESAFFSVLAAGGLPAPQRQVPLPGRGPLTRGLADAAYDDAKVIIELDGRRWHARLHAMRQDRERDAQVVRAGWVPLRFVHEQIVQDPATVCSVVAETRHRRLRQLRLAS